MVMDTQSLLHAVYVGAMLLGALYFFVLSRSPRGVPVYEYAIAMAIPLWSGAAYLAMTFGQGKIPIAGQITHYARYIDWVVTTPLLLLALSFTALHEHESRHTHHTLIAVLIGADVFMILSGLVADLSPYPLRYMWYALGCVALAAIFTIIWGPLRRVAEGNSPGVARVYRRVAGLLTVLWVGYPTFWLVGPSGMRLVDQTTETFLFVALPILSKVGWSIVDLHSLRGLHAPGEQPKGEGMEEPQYGRRSAAAV